MRSVSRLDTASLDGSGHQVGRRVLAASGLLDPKVGAPVRFSDQIGFDVRVVTGVAPQSHMGGASVTMLCAFDRRTGKAEVVEAPADAVLTALPATPSIEDISGAPRTSAEAESSIGRARR